MADDLDEFEELPQCEPAWQRLDRATAVRKRLLASGYLPLPVNGKAPPIIGWQDIQATDAIIDTWASKYAEATNTGILTRTTPAIDIDVLDPAVADELQGIAERMIGISAVRTGRAPKRALLFRADTSFSKISTPVFVSPDGCTHKVEVLGHGQQIVVFGDHVDTRRPYTWRGPEPGPNLKIGALPLLSAGKASEFITAAAQCMSAHGWTPKKKPNGGAADAGRMLDTRQSVSERERLYARATLDGCADELAQAASGERNDTLNKKAFRLGTMVARGWISSAEVFDALFGAAASCGLNADDGEEATRKTLNSGLDDGVKCPHPDLDTGQQEQIVYTEPTTPAVLGEWDAGDDTEPPRPRGWLCGNIFARRFVSSLYGEGGTGKTALRYAQYLSLTIGRSLTGDHVFQRSRVLIISLEDDRDELRRRILAAAMHHNISRADLKGWLFLSAPGGAAGKLMTLDNRGRLVRGGLAAAIEDAVVKHKIDLVALDPFIKTHSVEENSNSAIDDVVQILTDMTAKYDIAIDTPHHTSKGPADPGNANRGRGAGAMKDGGRLIYTLATMTMDEAKAFGVSEDERRYLIRMDSGKVNIAPPISQARWFRLVGVVLGNATELYPHGDVVQTVEPWTPPEVWTDLSIDLLNRILTTIDAGLPDGNRFTDGPRSPERSAWKVIVEHAPTKTEAQAREVVRMWVKNGVLVRRDYTNPQTRKEVVGLYVDNDKRPSKGGPT